MSYFDDASLVMIPSGYKTSKVYSVKPTDGSGDLTFSRSNDTATRVNSAGLIEKVRTNLLLQSNTFTNAAWVKDGCTITAAYGTAPDGTQTASRAVFSGADKTIYQLISATGVAGSLYIKGTAGQTIAFGIAGSESTFTLDGTWQRFTKSIAGSTSSIQLNTYGGVTARDVLIWSAQLEYGDIATDVIPTTSAAVSVGPVANVPRLDYLNSSCPRLLLEPQRTSLVTFSESFNNAAWGDAGITITANQAVSPDGYTNADLAVSSSSVNYLYQGLGSPFSGTYTVSIFAKKGSQSSFAFGLVAGGFTGGMGVKFNFDTQTFSTPTNYGNFTSISASYQSYGNGWYRLNLKGTTATSTTYFFVLGSLQESFAVNAYVYGAQAEAGAYATSYIPTLGAAVTRGADSASKTGISSLIGQTEGTLFADITIPTMANTGANLVSISLFNAGLTNLTLFDIYDSGDLLGTCVNGTVQALITKSGLTAGRHKVAFGYKANDFVLYVDGTLVGTDTSGTVGAQDSFGLQYGTSQFIGQQYVSQALVFKTRLSNADLAALTTI